MLNKFKSVTLIACTILIFMTITFYLFAVGSIFTVPIHMVSLMCILFAEIIAIIKIYIINKTAFFAANVVTSAFHVLSVIAFSFIFVNSFSVHIGKYILLNFLALCVMLFVDVLILLAANHVSVQNSKLNERKSAIACCVEKAGLLCSKYYHTDYIDDLENIVELLKYSDDSILTKDEQSIENKIDELHKLMESNDVDISDKILEIKQLIESRSIKLTGVKGKSY